MVDVTATETTLPGGKLLAPGLVDDRERVGRPGASEEEERDRPGSEVL
jgi:hypothetical protein